MDDNKVIDIDTVFEQCQWGVMFATQSGETDVLFSILRNIYISSASP